MEAAWERAWRRRLSGRKLPSPSVKECHGSVARPAKTGESLRPCHPGNLPRDSEIKHIFRFAVKESVLIGLWRMFRSGFLSAEGPADAASRLNLCRPFCLRYLGMGSIVIPAGQMPRCTRIRVQSSYTGQCVTTVLPYHCIVAIGKLPSEVFITLAWGRRGKGLS